MMKKTLTRALSLLLVLVMVLGAMPFAVATFENELPRDDTGTENETPADATVTISGSDTVVVGTSETYTANVTVTNGSKDDYDIAYDWRESGNVAANGNQATITPKQAGPWTMVCTVTLTPKTGKEGLGTLNATDSKDIERIPAPAAITIEPSTAEVEMGKEITLVAKDSEGATLSDAVWTSDKTDIATVSGGKVTGKAAGKATITATYNGESATCKVTVKAVTPVLAMADVFCKVNDTAANSRSRMTFAPTSLTKEDKVNLGLKLNVVGTSIENVKINDDYTYVTFDAKAPGTTNVTISSSNSDMESVTFTVTVSNGTLSCQAVSKEARSGAYLNLNPEYKNADNVSETADFTYSLSDIRGSLKVDKYGKVTCESAAPAFAKVTITAYDTDDTSYSSALAKCETYVSFYVDNGDIEVTMPSNARTLVFSDKYDIKESGRLDSLMTDGYDIQVGVNKGDNIIIDGLSTAEGRLTYLGTAPKSVNYLPQEMFTAGASGTAKFVYEISTSTGLGGMPLVQGEVTIEYDAAGGDIEYSTSYNKSVTFKESDFEEFWEDVADDEDFDGDLSYVEFPVKPETGKLYTSTSSTSSTYAYNTSQKFYYGTVPTGTNNKDLGSLTYVPSTSKLTSYDVTIPFVAYGKRSAETASGYVVIHVNETSDSITSRGIFFGSKYDGSNTYADMIAETFEDKTDEKLDYVIFELPDVEKATLYSAIPTDYTGNSLVAQGTRLRYNEKLYYGSSSSATLKKAALIPAAGFSGTITLEYTAYSDNGDEEYEGTLTFTVAKKTKSGVFTDVGTTYNWAADSVDFLYYEGIAQGSNNKYNPAANITRGDFMLMLYRAFLEDDYSTYNVTTNFADVAKGTTEYFQETYQAVGVAKYLGIAQGTNNKYNPKAYITREEAMTLIYRTLSKINRDLTYTSGVSASSFSDYSKISSYATTAISNLVGHGVIVGSNNKISPKTNITRAEMACILHRVITY